MKSRKFNKELNTVIPDETEKKTTKENNRRNHKRKRRKRQQQNAEQCARTSTPSVRPAGIHSLACQGTASESVEGNILKTVRLNIYLLTINTLWALA